MLTRRPDRHYAETRNRRDTDMTWADTSHTTPAAVRGLAVRIRTVQRHISDRAHSPGDSYARARGWTVTEVTGRFGMGGRIYHDPRFGASDLARPGRGGFEWRQRHGLDPHSEFGGMPDADQEAGQ